MNLILPASLAVAASMFLPAMATAQSDCDSYISRDPAALTVNAFDDCKKAGAWDLADRDTQGHLLFEAVRNGVDRSVLEHMMKNGASFPEAGLLAATYLADGDLIDWFLDQGADANGVVDWGETPLSISIQHFYREPAKSLEIMSQLLEHGANPNVVFPYGGNGVGSAMHQSVETSADVVDMLLAHGGDINLHLTGGAESMREEGMTPLHLALMYEPKEEMVQHLLAKGADPLAPAANGLRPIDMDALEGARVDPRALALVRAAAGGDVSLQIKDESWFQVYCQSGMSSGARKYWEADPIGVDGVCNCAAEEAVIISEIRVDRGLVAPNAEAFDRLHKQAFQNATAICGIRYEN